MGTQADEKAIRLIQGIIREGAIGQVIDGNLAGALARRIVTGLRTIRKKPEPRQAKPAFMAVPGADGETDVIKATPTPYGATPSAEGKGAAIKGDTVDREEMVKAHKDANPESFEELLDGADSLPELSDDEDDGESEYI